MRKTTFACLLMALPALPTLAAPPPAQSWQLIDKRNDERISLDKTRISRLANGNTAAWSRLTLGFDIPDSHTGVRYTAIEALNSYDCSKRQYVTLKRIYVDSKGQPVREEKVDAPRSISIETGSFEEKLLPHVCKPRAVGEMKEVAEKVVAALNGPTPGAQSTEQRKQKASAVTVADTGNKGRLIELPRIEPEMADKPPPPLPAKPEIKKPVSEKAAEQAEADAEKPAKPQTKDGKSAAATAGAAPNYHTGNVSRAEIERQLATFGPRKSRTATTKKAAAAPKEAATSKPRHWSYEGKGGPEAWAHLSPDNHACNSGKRQSPIDIGDGIRVDLEPIQFAYVSSPWSVLDTGHTVQVNIPDGSAITVMGRRFQLLQFHFHKPAEERVNGRSYDMVAHFVHKDADGNLAVVAVLMEKGPEHPLVQAVWNNLPLEQGMLVTPSSMLDLNKLLPEKRDYWTYMGSLTTPPCTEGVLWMVMKQPLQVSAEQIAIFGRLYPHNARPIQPSNNRLIKESR
ncbi:MAG TPA: carbonic anhydrase [Rhodocyclaceae bacterium]|nr:carbonic anhydrase [Rhodocyclaceae bacterium]